MFVSLTQVVLRIGSTVIIHIIFLQLHVSDNFIMLELMAKQIGDRFDCQLSGVDFHRWSCEKASV